MEDVKIEKTEERVLAYNLATEISDEDCEFPVRPV